MFNKYLKENKDSDFSPNFINAWEPIKKTGEKIEDIKKAAIKEKKAVLKPLKKNYKNVAKFLEDKHDDFEAALKKGEKELKIWHRYIFSEYLQSKRKKRENSLKLSYYRSLFSFLMALIFLIIPFKILAYLQVFNIQKLEDKIISKSKSAISRLMAGGSAFSQLDIKTANNSFASASMDFVAANEELSRISDVLLQLASLSSDPKFKLAAESKDFMNAGLRVASLGEKITKSLSGLEAKNENNWITLLDNFLLNGPSALEDAKDLGETLHKVNVKNLPPEYRDQFLSLSRNIDALPDKLTLMIEAAQQLKTFLGSEKDKRYLLVFQNNAEMRGSGGFLGSYALVDFREGKIRNLEVPGGGSYDTEAGMIDKIKAPEPLWLVNPQWYFWDANWWPDWPTTAKNLMWFYEKSDGPTVDGVISFTPSVIESLLRITGPIDLRNDYGVVITSENFWQEVQMITERDNIAKTDPQAVAHLPEGEKSKPKKIIGDLMAKIMEILPQKMDKDNILNLIKIAESNLSSKQIMFYFKDGGLQEAIASRGLDGAIAEAPLDYLMVTDTNIAGAKTDRVINEEIFHETSVNNDGTMIDTVIIKRTHTAAKNEPLVGVRNVDWLRVYVPRGSDLLSFSGVSRPDAKYFEEPGSDWIENDFIAAHEGLAIEDKNTGTKIYEENNKTVFANWVMLDPGQSVTVTLRYRLPFNLWQMKEADDFRSRLDKWLGADKSHFYPYSILIQKQPGSVNQSFKTDLIIPDSYSVLWSSNTESNYQQSLNKDKFFSSLISHKK